MKVSIPPNFFKVGSSARQLPAAETAWEAEIRARVTAYERGERELIPAEETLARARKLAE